MVLSHSLGNIIHDSAKKVLVDVLELNWAITKLGMSNVGMFGIIV